MQLDICVKHVSIKLNLYPTTSTNSKQSVQKLVFFVISQIPVFLYSGIKYFYSQKILTYSVNQCKFIFTLEMDLIYTRNNFNKISSNKNHTPLIFLMINNNL